METQFKTLLSPEQGLKELCMLKMELYILSFCYKIIILPVPKSPHTILWLAWSEVLICVTNQFICLYCSMKHLVKMTFLHSATFHFIFVVLQQFVVFFSF